MSAHTYRFPCFVVGVAASCALVSTSGTAAGRPDGEGRNWFPQFSGGWAFAQSDTSDVLDDDWMISGGVLFWPSDWPVGVEFDVAFVDFDISDEAINAVNAAIEADSLNSGRIDDGDVESWQFTVNGIWSPSDNDTGFYLTGGVGAYRLEGTLAQTGLVYYPPVCDLGTGGGAFQAASERARSSRRRIPRRSSAGTPESASASRLAMVSSSSKPSTTKSTRTRRTWFFAPLTFGFRW